MKEFFRVLFENTQGYIEIRTIKAEDKDKKDIKQRFYRTKDVDRLVSDLTNDELLETKGADIYFGICPRKDREGKEENVGEIKALWVDIDCGNNEVREQRLDSLRRFEFPPSIIVNSGHGFHCYWLLDRPYPIKSREDRLGAKGCLKGLALALSGDKAFDLCRILRVPGTRNLKNLQNPLRVKIVEFRPTRRYKLSQFEQLKVDVENPVATHIDTSMDKIPERFWRLLEENKNLKDTWERERPDLKDKTRSGYDMALAGLLMPYGFTDTEAAAILKASPSGRGEEAKSQYLALTIGKAKASWKRRKEIVSKRVEGTKGGRKEQPSKSRFNPRPYAEEVVADLALKYDEYKRFWIYDESAKIWKSDAEVRLNSILRKRVLGREDYKRYCVGEVIADLQGLTYTDEPIQEPGAHLIAFKNKIYDLESDELLDYSPDYFFINKLPVSINKENTKCPTIDRIFEELVRPEDVVTLYEILAYTLYRRYPYPKLFILYGSGANGKTAYIKMLRRFLGTENISLVGANDLQFNRFASSQLFGKLLNVSGEMDYTLLKNTSKLKQCCGEDLIYCERKFKEPFPFVNYAKMIFLTNQVPLTIDQTFAFYRRIFLLEFPNRFILGDNADPMLVDSIPEAEFEGLAWKCLRRLKELYNRDFVFTNHPTTEDVTRQYEELSDPLLKFLNENTQRDVNAHIAVDEFADRFVAYLTKNGLRVWTVNAIGRAMKVKGFEQKSLPVTKENGKRSTSRAWLGLKCK